MAPPGSLKPFLSHGCTGSTLPSRSIAFAVSIRSAAGTTSCTSPIALALAGSSDEPVVIICNADCWSVRRGTLCVPPAPGKMPIFTSGKPMTGLSLSAITRPWQASDNSVAPPMQVPLMALTHGLPQVSSLRNSHDMRPAISKSVRVPCWGSRSIAASNRLRMASIMVMSAPPENEPFFPLVNTTPFTPSSATTASMMASSSSITASVNTFMDLPGMSQVTSMMPSASVSVVKFS